MPSLPPWNRSDVAGLLAMTPLPLPRSRAALLRRLQWGKVYPWTFAWDVLHRLRLTGWHFDRIYRAYRSIDRLTTEDDWA